MIFPFEIDIPRYASETYCVVSTLVLNKFKKFKGKDIFFNTINNRNKYTRFVLENPLDENKVIVNFGFFGCECPRELR